MGGLLRLSKRPSAKRDVSVRCAERRTRESATMENTPAKRALATLDSPPPADVTGPPRRISKRVRVAIGAMVSGKCKRICDAAEHAGLARESLSRALSTPHVAEHLRQKVI